MARRLDHVLVIDIEATCWDGEPPPGETADIIEVGVVPLEVSTGRRLLKRSLLVRPGRSAVSAFCTRLTTITPDMAAGGVAFAEACRVLVKEFDAPKRVWASWGDFDRRQFERQCRETGVPYPFGPTHLNAKTLFALGRGLVHEVGLPQAAALAGVPMEGTHHRGDDDAWNIAGVLATVLRRLREGGG